MMVCKLWFALLHEAVILSDSVRWRAIAWQMGGRGLKVSFGSVSFTICLEKGLWLSPGAQWEAEENSDLENHRITGWREPPGVVCLWSKIHSKQVQHVRLLGDGLAPVYHRLPGTEEPKLDPVPRHGLRS